MASPESREEEKLDEVLRRMLSTPPKEHKDQKRKKQKPTK